MKVEQIKTPDDIEIYIEGCLNDFETAISTKGETVVFLAELVVHIYKEAKKEQLTIPAVSNCNCDKENQPEEEYDIQHLINDTYQVVGRKTGTVWKQGTMEECNDWVML